MKKEAHLCYFFKLFFILIKNDLLSKNSKGNLIIYELADKNFNNDGTLIGKHPFMLVLFKMNGCPHCIHFYPDLDETSQ